jgi:hypothetical protein
VVVYSKVHVSALGVSEDGWHIRAHMSATGAVTAAGGCLEADELVPAPGDLAPVPGSLTVGSSITWAVCDAVECASVLWFSVLDCSRSRLPGKARPAARCFDQVNTVETVGAACKMPRAFKYLCVHALMLKRDCVSAISELTSLTRNKWPNSGYVAVCNQLLVASRSSCESMIALLCFMYT